MYYVQLCIIIVNCIIIYILYSDNKDLIIDRQENISRIDRTSSPLVKTIYRPAKTINYDRNIYVLITRNDDGFICFIYIFIYKIYEANVDKIYIYRNIGLIHKDTCYSMLFHLELQTCLVLPGLISATKYSNVIIILLNIVQ